MRFDKGTVLWMLVVAIVVVWLIYPDVIFDALESADRFIAGHILPELDKASMSYLHRRGKSMKAEESKVDGD